jgi:hypothetical protein
MERGNKPTASKEPQMITISSLHTDLETAQIFVLSLSIGMTLEEVHAIIYGTPVPVAPPAAPRAYSSERDPEDRGNGRMMSGGCYVNYGMMAGY